MGQSASKKVASRLTQVATKYGTPVAPSSTTVVNTSSSSSSKLSNAAAEAITTTPSAASSSKQDQEQLDFLKTLTHPSQRPHSTDPTSPHTAAVPTSPPSPPSTNHPHPQTVVHPPNDDEYPEMPPDLIKFMTDVGPVQKVQVGNSTETARSNRTTYPPSASAAATPKRHPRMTMAEPATTTTTTHTKKNSRADSSTPARDHTRIHQTMPLSKDYPLDAGFNTMRTTSFSNRQDPVDVNEFGLDVVTLYRFLSNTHPTALATVLATNTAADPDARTEHERLLRLTQQYCEAPVLLSDADLTYVGAHPGRVEDLLTVHQGLTRLDARQAKLVVQDWMDIEDATETESAGVAQSLSRSRLERKARERAAGKAGVEPSSSS